MPEEEDSDSKPKRVDEIAPVMEIGLEISLKIRDDKHDAVIRGWKEATYILIDCRDVTTGELKIVPDTSVVIRLINKGFVLSCSTTIMSVVKPPVNVIVLEYPSRYEKMQLRKHPRLDICLPALFNDMGAPTPEAKAIRHKSTVLDISTGGVLLASKQKLEVNSQIAVSIKLSSTEKIVNIPSVIKNKQKGKSVGHDIYCVGGVEFQTLSDDNKEKLVKFIEANRPFRS